MKRQLRLPSAVFLGGSILCGTMALAAEMPVDGDGDRTNAGHTVKKPQRIVRLQEFDRPLTRAALLLKVPAVMSQSGQPGSQSPLTDNDEPEEEIVVEGQKEPVGSSPNYVITGEEIDKQGSTSVTDVLRGLPGFAINDTGFGADIHTGFYYRGTTINQNTFLLDGRPIGSNVNTYHGATDLNTFLTGASTGLNSPAAPPPHSTAPKRLAAWSIFSLKKKLHPLSSVRWRRVVPMGSRTTVLGLQAR